MLSSLHSLVFPLSANPSVNGAPYPPSLLHCNHRNRSKSSNPITVRAKLKNEGWFSGHKALPTKCSTKWASYGGCIPSILKALSDVTDLDEALKPWEGALNSKERTIILKEQTDWRRALEIFDWFRKKGCYELNIIHYNIMLRFLGKARKWDLVGSLWSEMQLLKIMPTNSTYGTLIDAYSKGGMSKEALVWVGEMYKQGMEPDEVTAGIVIQTYKKAGEFGKAEQFFQRWSLAARDDPEEWKRYSLYTYNTMIDTYGKAGQVEEASNTLCRMLREGIVPDRVTFNTMIHLCGNHGHMEEVTSLMEMMEEIRCPPDTRTYNILISLYAKNEDIDAATSYFMKMKAANLEPDAVGYRTLLYAYCIRNMVCEAESLVSDMEECGHKIDEYTQSTLTRMYVSAGMLEQSWSWFERFLDTMSSECFSANIDAFGEGRHLSLVERAFACYLGREKLNILVFNVMIKAYGIAERHDKILSGAALPHKAKSYLRKMQEIGFVSDCVLFSVVISSFAKLGEVEEVDGLFKEMISAGVKPDIVVYSIMINAFAEVGKMQETLNYVNSMKGAGYVINSIICNSLIKLYTKVGCLGEAKLTYETLKSLEDAPDVYSSNCMIDLYCENAMVKEAEEIFENLKHKGKANEFSYAMMLCLYKKIGRYGEAYVIAKEMNVLGLLSDTLSYNNVIGLYASDGRLKEAIKSFKQMLVLGVQPNDATFRLLGVALLKHGVSKEAINRLELARKKDAQGGLQEWVKAMYTMARVDNDSFKGGGKFKEQFEGADSMRSIFSAERGSFCRPVIFKQCSYG